MISIGVFLIISLELVSEIPSILNAWLSPGAPADMPPEDTSPGVPLEDAKAIPSEILGRVSL